MKCFLRQVAESILSQIEWKQLSRTTLVFPSHRAGLVLKDELLRLQQERQAQAVWAPRVRTLTQLQDELSPFYSEDELFTIVRLYKLYRASAETQQSKNPMPLDIFYGWGRQMVADFTNIDASMLASEVPNFFENTIAARELSEWKLDPEVEERLRALMAPSDQGFAQAASDSIRKQYEILWHQLFDLYSALKTEMAAEQKGFAGMRQRAVIEHWDDDSVQQQLKGRTFIFVGFNYLLPVERDLMVRLRDAEQALFYWDYVPDFQTNEKAFSFAQQNKSILGGTFFAPQQSFAQSPRPITLIQCASRETQAQYVHRWLQDNYTEKGQKVGVVICDETMLEPVIYTLPSVCVDGEAAPINITKGFPLRNTAVYARVVAWLNDKSRGQAEDIVTPSIIDALVEKLYPTTSETAENPDEIDTTDALAWKELLVLESEYQTRKILNQMRLLLTEGLGDIPFTLKLLRLLIRRMMESVTMPFHGEPVTDIQVMGVLETRLLDFDKLLILNVEEGVIPQRQQDISFIPYYLRKTYHMQTPDERATVYAYNFFRLLSRTDQATILYASADTADGGKGMSRFIMQMLYSPEFNVQKQILQESNMLSAFHDQLSTDNSVSLLSTLYVEDGVLKKENGKRYRLSPSSLNTYIACPRSFYLQYILRLQPREEEEVLFEPATIGSFVHKSMEYIYRTYLHCAGSEPVPVSPDEIEAVYTDESKLQCALDAAYKAMNEQVEKPYIPENHVSENVIIKGYVRNILERDRKDAEVGLKIYLLEQDRDFAIHLDEIGELYTGGTIDRLDIYGPKGHEHLRVVDYKSGAYTDTTHAKKMSARWEDIMESEEKGYVRQTLIYSHAVMAHDRTKLPIEPNLYFCRRKLTDIVTTIDVENETLYDYRTIEKTFLESLKPKIAELLTTTRFEPCDEDKCPSFCPFFDLCGRKPKEF